MKKRVLALLLIAATSSAAPAATKGISQTWGLCGTAFPGLGHLGAIFYLPCAILSTNSRA